MNFFFYGTLKDKATFKIITGLNPDDYEWLPATLEGFSLHPVLGAGFPAVVPDPGSHCRGVVVTGLPEEVAESLDRYEGCPNLYQRVTTTGTGLSTHTYVWTCDMVDLGEKVEVWDA